MEIPTSKTHTTSGQTADHDQEQHLINLDLAWFKIEGIANERTFQHKRIKPTHLNDTVVAFSISDHVICLYLKDRNELYRVEGCLILHWMRLCRAFRITYPGVKIVN